MLIFAAGCHFDVSLPHHGDAGGDDFGMVSDAQLMDLAGAPSDLRNAVGGKLQGKRQDLPMNDLDLTAEGRTDWMDWALNQPTDLTRKMTATPWFGTPSYLKQPTLAGTSNYPVAIISSDGTPTGNATSSSGLTMFGGNGAGIVVTVGCDTTARTVRLYLGGHRSRGMVVAHLSDDSAADYSDNSLGANTDFFGGYQLDYNCASDGKTLSITWVLSSTNGGSADVAIYAATLQ